MYLPKQWLRLNEAAERLNDEKSFTVSENDILHLVIAGKLRAYATLSCPITANRYRIIWPDKTKAPEQKHCGWNLFKHFLPLTRTTALEIDTRGIAEIHSPATFDDDPLEAFEEEEQGITWKISPPLKVEKSSIVVLHDDLFNFVEKLASELSNKEPESAFPSNGSGEPTALSAQPLGKRDHQIEIILAVAAALEYEPLKIPDGGKAKIKSGCITRPALFTESSFTRAWQQAVDGKLVRMENHDKFIK